MSTAVKQKPSTATVSGPHSHSLPSSSVTAPGVLIRGKFKQKRQNRILVILEWLMGSLLGLSVLTFLGFYTFSVYLETGINQQVEKTKQMNELNKDLETKLDRVQSFHYLAKMSKELPNLTPATEWVEISTPKTSVHFNLSEVPSSSRTAVYGY